MQLEDKNNKNSMEIPEDLTIPKLFLEKAKIYGKSKAAMREKEFGIWRPITWHAYLENVKYLSLGLVSLGLNEGDKVSMIGDNRPEGLWAEPEDGLLADGADRRLLAGHSGRSWECEVPPAGGRGRAHQRQRLQRVQ